MAVPPRTRGKRVTKSGFLKVFGQRVYWRLNPKDNRTWLYFSERHGYEKTMRIGRLVIGLVTS